MIRSVCASGSHLPGYRSHVLHVYTACINYTDIEIVNTKTVPCLGEMENRWVLSVLDA